MAEFKAFTIRISPKMWDKIKKCSEDKNMSMNKFIIKCVDERLKNILKKELQDKK